MFHLKTKFTAEYSKEEENILDVKLIEGGFRQICLLNLYKGINILGPTFCHPFHCKKIIP